MIKNYHKKENKSLGIKHEEKTLYDGGRRELHIIKSVRINTVLDSL